MNRAKRANPVMPKILYLLGRNINYSLSPAIHNYSAKKLGLPYIYTNADIAPDAVTHFLEFACASASIAGFNITRPYKQVVADFFGNPDGLQSVNIAYRQRLGSKPATAETVGRPFACTSADGSGMFLGLKHAGIRPAKTFTQIVLLGAGGAVQSVVAELARERYRGRCIILSRATAIPNSFKKLDQLLDIDFRSFRPAVFRDVLRQPRQSLVIQGTSAPLAGDMLQEYAAHLHRDTVGGVVDMVYGTPSELYHRACAQKIPAQDGLPMLIETARVSQQLWWQQTLPFATLNRVVRSQLRSTLTSTR